jgi:hypothetical protein
VAAVKGGGGGMGGNGPRYVQFRDKAHVEQRLRALGATVVGRTGPKVTHIIVPAGGEALAEEQRRHGAAAKGDGDGAEGGGGGGGSGGGNDGDGNPVIVRDNPWQLSKVASGPLVAVSEGRGPVVVTEGWVMRHVRAAAAGLDTSHAPAAVAAHAARVTAEKKAAAGDRKAAVKRKLDEAASGVEQRPGRERVMNRVARDRVGRALAQRLFLVQRQDISRGDRRDGNTDGAGPGSNPGASGGDGGGGGGLVRYGHDGHAHRDGDGGGSSGKWHAVFEVFGTTG